MSRAFEHSASPWAERRGRRKQALMWLLDDVPPPHPQNEGEFDALREELRGHYGELEKRIAELNQEQHALIRLLERASTLQDAHADSLSRMSHSMRTPLNAILGFAQLLSAENSAEPLPDRQRQQALMIETAGRRLLSLVDEAMELARLDRQAKRMDPTAVPLDQMLLEIVAAVGQHKPHPVDVQIETPAPAAWADPTRLAEVVINLLGHAFMYSPRDAHVLLQASALPQSGEVCISVRDNGPGLRPEEQAQLFLPFVHADARTTKTAERGLRWPVLQRLANWMGGRITVVSQLGNGSVYTLHLPAADTGLGSTPPDQRSRWLPSEWLQGDDAPGAEESTPER